MKWHVARNAKKAKHLRQEAAFLAKNATLPETT
jgi:hypothetical protein